MNKTLPTEPAATPLPRGSASFTVRPLPPAMSDIPFEIRLQLLRLNPELSISQADDLIAGVPDCYVKFPATIESTASI